MPPFDPIRVKALLFDVFGTCVDWRNAVKDLESRFLTEEMGSRSLRSDIPINLPDDFRVEALELRNKLLLFRFHRRFDVKLDPTLADPKLEPRLNQILLPLLSVVSDADLRQEIKSVAEEAQADTVADRGLLTEAQVLEILAELMSTTERPVVPVSEVTMSFIERFGAEQERPITPRWIGSILRRRLNLRTYKSHGVYVVPMTQRPKVELLCKRYGVTFMAEKYDTIKGDEGTLGTSQE